MPTPRLSDTRMREVFEFLEAHHTALAAASALGIPRGTFDGRLREARRVHPEWFIDKVDAPAKVPNPTPPPKTVEDHVTEHRTGADLKATKAQLKSAWGRIAELQDKLRDLEWATETKFSPAEWTFSNRILGQSEHMPYLLTSDFHAGEVVLESQTEAGYGYDTPTFRKRYRKMIEIAIYLSEAHAGGEWSYPGFIYARAGDAISGMLHPELIETDDMTPMDAVTVVAEEEAAGITLLAEHFGKVEIKTFRAGGNHGRNTLKPYGKNAAAHSYEALIEYLLKMHFKADPRVTFQSSESFDVKFPIYGQNILLTHGDRIGSRGGQGFVGPAATIMRGVQRIFQEQGALGHHINQVHLGHFHYPLMLPFCISNGSLPGYTEYAKANRMRPTPPQQMFCYFHPKRGIVDYKPIILTD